MTNLEQYLLQLENSIENKAEVTTIFKPLATRTVCV